MASNIVTLNTVVQIVAALSKNAIHRVKSITINNKAGSQAHDIIIQDGFTPDISAGVAIPVATTVNRWRTNVLQGAVDTFDEKDLSGVRCIGTLGIISGDITDASCYITVGYEDE